VPFWDLQIRSGLDSAKFQPRCGPVWRGSITNDRFERAYGIRNRFSSRERGSRGSNGGGSRDAELPESSLPSD
jgi:hypothetical protein